MDRESVADREVQAAYRGDLRGFLRRIGEKSVASFLGGFPGMPLVELATRFPGSGLCAAGLRRAQMREAVLAGSLREAAMDCLVRDINENFASGWGSGALLELRTAAPLVWLLNALDIDAGASYLRENAKHTWGALLESYPKPGWRPQSPEDPLIQGAFRIGWPEKVDRSTRAGSPAGD